MPSPQLNLRVPSEHHTILKTVAARLREDAAFRDQLAALVAGVAPHSSPVAGDSIAARLEALEARLQEVEEQQPLRMGKLDRLENRVAALEELVTGQEAPQTVAQAAGEPVEASEALEPLEGAQEAPGGPQKRRKWTEEDFAALRDLAGRGATQADACRELGRTSSDVNKYWKALGLPTAPRKGRILGKRRTQGA